MVSVKVSAFGGMIPAQDDTLLAENGASFAQNTFLDSGALQGLKTPKSIHTLVSGTARYAFRIPDAAPDKNHILQSHWLEFDDPDTNVLQSQVANDSFERFYFASPSVAPKYNTKARMIAGSAAYFLGVPAPSVAPAVVPTGGVSGTTEIRAYVYTWVTAYGEEGPPSPPVIVTGKIDDSWGVTMTAPGGGDTTGRNLTRVRVYRTITANTGTAVFYQVVDQAIGTTTYADTVSDVTLSGNHILDTADHGAPPTDLQGIVSMPNGMMAGWRGNEVWFCEPFKPWAWPAEYTTSVDAIIVGLGVVGQTLVILTQGFPYAATGISPANMAFSKIATFEPCMSRGSIVSTAQGVLYASPNGIVLAAYGVVQNATAQLATRDKWLELVRPETLRAARLSASYYAWGAVGVGAFEPSAFEPGAFAQTDDTGAFSGVLVNLVDPRIAWVELGTQQQTTENVMTDIWSGEVFLIRDGAVLWLDLASGNAADPYIWRSKKYQFNAVHSLSAIKVFFDPIVHDPAFALAPARNVAPVQALAANQYGLIRVYASSRLVMTRELRVSGELMRVPGGFKDEEWQIEIEARVKVTNIQGATTVKELAKI